MSDSLPRPLRRAMGSPRGAAIAGVLFALLFASALVLIESSLPGRSASGSEWMNADRLGRISVGLSLIPFSGIAFLWFMGVIRDHINDAHDQLFSSVFIGSGLLFLAMIFVSAALAGGIVGAIPLLPDDQSRTEISTFGRTLMLEVTNIYALRMAGVLLISLATMWLRTGAMPRWLAILTYAIAALLLLVTTQNVWITLVFPAWVLGVSILILWNNYRRREPSAATT